MNKPERLENLKPQIAAFPPLIYGEQNNHFVDMIENLDPGGALLDKRYFGALSQIGLKSSFEEDDKMMEGRKGGVHHSYAGRMYFEGKKDQRITRLVFVKPFLDAKDCRNGQPSQHMAHELSVSRSVAALYPYTVTFKTLGVAKSYNGTPQLLTEFNMSVTAISNIFRPKSENPPPQINQIAKGIKIAMDQAGTWVAGLGSTHRDFHAGNVARGIENTPWFNDNETVLPLERNKSIIVDSDLNRRSVLNDLSAFYHSIVNPKITRSDVAQRVFSVLDNKQHMNSFLKTYQSSLQRNMVLTGTELPERYFMSQGTFTGLVMNSTRESREKLLKTNR